MPTFAGTVPFVAHSRVPRGAHWSGTFSYHVFSLTRAGSVTYSLPDGVVEIVPGDLLHFAPEAFQDWLVQGTKGWQVAYLIVGLPAALSELLPQPTLAPGVGRIHLDPSELRKVARAFREMQEWSERSTPLREQLVINLIEQVLLRVHSGRPTTEIDPRIGQARDFLHDSVETPVVLADVAHAAGLSRARLSALFKAHLDTTPIVYLERLRLERAARLLLFTTDDIAAIAERLGYAERGYFDKRFKRRWGVTPRSYRLGVHRS